MAVLGGRQLASYHPGANVNVLSQGGMVDDGHHVRYDEEADAEPASENSFVAPAPALYAALLTAPCCSPVTSQRRSPRALPCR